MFQWIDALPAKAAGPQCESDRRWLVWDIPSKDLLVSYRPLSDTPALFRTFADLEPTEDAFVSFVNRFGMLGTREVACIGNQLISGESLTRFLSEHNEVGQVVRMIDALNRGRGLQICAEAICGEPRRLGLPHPFIGSALRSGGFRELKEACGKWVQATVNEHLGGTGDVGDAVLTVLGRDPSGDLRIQPQTRSLLGILWLQCARAAEGDQVFRQCKCCRGWMLIAPRAGKNRQAMYCSAVCKVRAFRKRKPAGRRRPDATTPRRGTK
jgi:hypothetical protein